jgi:hypothetical protein
METPSNSIMERAIPVWPWSRAAFALSFHGWTPTQVPRRQSSLCASDGREDGLNEDSRDDLAQRDSTAAVGTQLSAVQDIENAPVISMGPYLIESQQARLLTTISIYTLRGESREQCEAALYECGGAPALESDGKKRQRSLGRSIGRPRKLRCPMVSHLGKFEDIHSTCHPRRE